MHIKSILCASTAFSIARLSAFMPNDHIDVVIVEGADGQPLRINKDDFDADQAEDGAKQYKLHSDADKYNSNGELMANDRSTDRNASENIPATQSPTDAKANIMNNPDNQNTGTAATNFGVVQEKRKFFVVDMNNEGKRIDDLDGIDAKGYKDAKAAWDAVFHVRTEAATVTPVAPANADADGDGKDNA